MNVVGKNDSYYSVSNISLYKETYGVPLIYIMDVLYKSGLIVAWDHYIFEMLNKGQSINSLKAQIIEALVEFYGPMNKQLFNNKIDELIRIMTTK